MPALYHTHPEQTDFTAQVVSCEAVPEKENLWRVVLSDTAFYPTGGGQPCERTKKSHQGRRVQFGQSGLRAMHTARP